MEKGVGCKRVDSRIRCPLFGECTVREGGHVWGVGDSAVGGGVMEGSDGG